MYDEIIEIAENRAYLNAVRNDGYGPNLDLLRRMPSFNSLKDYVDRLKEAGELSFSKVFHEPIGYYNLKCFLVADYSVDKAVFISDVELYKKMRDPSARLKVAKLLFERFVAEDTTGKFHQGESVFERQRVSNSGCGDISLCTKLTIALSRSGGRRRRSRWCRRPPPSRRPPSRS